MRINSGFIRSTTISVILPALIIVLTFFLTGFPLAQETRPNCDQSLFKIGKKLRLFEIVTGKLPEKLSDLYFRGFVKQLDDFQCSKKESGIDHAGEIDDKTHFELLPETGTGEEDPILVTKANAGTPQRALLRNGEVINWGKKETPETEGTADAEQPSTPDQPRSEVQKKLDGELLKAAEKGNLDEVQKAIQAGADVNAKGKNGSTPLGWAANKGHEDMVRLLINARADINWESPRGQTALHVAAHQGQVAVIKILISSGADVNQKIKSKTAPKRYQGATALFMAVENNKAEAIQVLLQSGANVNAINSFGATPLMFSVSSQNLEPLLTLIEAGADLNAKIKADAGPGAGTTALMGAVIQGNLKSLQVLLLAGADVKAKDTKGSTAFDYAKKKGDMNIVHLLREPMEATRLAKSGLESDMMKAIENGNVQIVKWLLQLGLNANAKDEKGITALMLAIDKGSVEMVRALLNSGADVNAADREFGATPLIVAASKEKGEITKILIQSGAEINRKAKGDSKGEGAGWTALMAAAMVGDPDLVSQLLSAGAKAGLTNDAGESALDIAKKEEKLEVVRLLEKVSKQKPHETVLHAEGLVSYYPFNGNSRDESGNEIHGKVHGALLTSDRFGIANKSYYLDGKDDYFDLGKLGGIAFADQISVSLWIKPESFANWRRFFARGYAGGCTSPWVNIYLGTWDLGEKDKPRFALALNGRQITTPRGVNYKFRQNEWYHVVGSYNGSQMKLYVNGTIISAINAKGQIDLNSKNFSLATELDGCSGGNFNGIIDDVRIYKRALLESEITDIFKLGH